MPLKRSRSAGQAGAAAIARQAVKIAAAILSSSLRKRADHPNLLPGVEGVSNTSKDIAQQIYVNKCGGKYGAVFRFSRISDKKRCPVAL